ncbi:serine/threonine kinase [Aureococcus anophagefferens]|nr:serine/threonine kinase [Aureococcus anophagefferens]
MASPRSAEDRWQEVRRVGGESAGQLCVAKKVPTDTLNQRDREAAHRECALLRTLEHPHIVNFVESWESERDDGQSRTMHLIMEWCEQGDLAYHINEKKAAGERFAAAHVWRWFHEMASALEYMHRRRVLHRDLKSTNVFVDGKFHVKLGDLGIAKILESTLAHASTVVGTPNYLSPELCENKPYSYSSDVWALGCVLYKLCALKRPFDASNLFGIVYSVVKGDVDLDAVSPDASDPLRKLVTRLLTKDADVRPTVTAILADEPRLRALAANDGASDDFNDATTCSVLNDDDDVDDYDDDFESEGDATPSFAHKKTLADERDDPSPSRAAPLNSASPPSGGRYAGMDGPPCVVPLTGGVLSPRDAAARKRASADGSRRRAAPPVYALCRSAHERCASVKKADFFDIVARDQYGACLEVEQVVFADLTRGS